MKDIIYLTILFDYYEKLLDEKDRGCFKNYYFENFSLSEISENLGISRNAIHKSIKNTIKYLYEYENKLKLYHL